MLGTEVKKLELENAELKRMLEELKREYEGGGEKPMACRFCRYYTQHYVRGRDGGFTETYLGHCFHGRTKQRGADDSCRYFELKG